MQKIRSARILKAFQNAFAGLYYFFRNERNGRIQFIIGLFTIVASIILHLSQQEWIAILLCIGAVLSAEMINSSIEKLCNYIQPAYDLQIKIIKDVAAGAVLFISLISAITGSIIFLPKLWHLL